MKQKQPSKDQRWLDAKPSRFALLRKAMYVYLVLAILFVACWTTGYAAARNEWVNYKETLDSPVMHFSKDAESEVPVYRDVLLRYRAWHETERMQSLSRRDRWGLHSLQFLDKFAVDNTMMMVRAAFVVPIVLHIPSQFSQGVFFAQFPGSERMMTILILELGGYLLTIGAMMNLTLWVLFPRRFGLVDRGIAFRSGLKVLGTAWVLSAVGIGIGSWMETEMLLRLVSST